MYLSSACHVLLSVDCGGSRPVVQALQEVSDSYDITLKIEIFDW